MQFLLPNFYGSPAHHSYVDAFSGERIANLTETADLPRDYIFWGVKNYVEGALYLGVLPLFLGLYGFIKGFRQRRLAGYVLLFGLLALLALSFMFGAQTYALLFYLPGMNQLNSPFRWVFALTLAVSALAGIGLDQLGARTRSRHGLSGTEALVGIFLIAGGAGANAGRGLCICQLCGL